MGVASSLGLISGIDYEELVNKLILLERNPITLLENRKTDIELKIGALDALGIKLEAVDGLNLRQFYYKPKKEDLFLRRFVKSRIPIIMRKVGAKRHGKIKSTIHLDLERGIKTEVEFINGHIARKATELGLEAPINDFMVKAIQEIEAGKRTTSMDNLPEYEAAAQLSREKLSEEKS